MLHLSKNLTKARLFILPQILPRFAILIITILLINLNSIAIADPPTSTSIQITEKPVIEPDHSPPSTPEVLDDGDYTISSSQFHAIWSSVDPQSGISGYRYGIGTIPGFVDVVGWTFVELETEVTHTGLNLEDGESYYFTVSARNGVGLWSKRGISNGIVVDTQPPQGTIIINNDEPYTNSTSATLSLSASDSTSGMVVGAQMQFSNDNIEWSTPEDYDVTNVWILSEGGGEKTVYVKFRDVAGNWSGPFFDDIFFDDTPPVITGVYDDGEFTFSRTELHATWLAQDNGAPIVEYQYAIGIVQGEIGNDIVDWTSNGLNTEVTVTDLSLTVGQIYYFNVKARNAADLWSDVGSSDGITVLNQTPEIILLIPEDNSTFIEEDIVEIIVQALDPDGDILEYCYLIDAGVMQDWTTLATYSWQTQIGDVRLKTITVEVRDEYGAVVSGETNVFLFRKPPSPE